MPRPKSNGSRQPPPPSSPVIRMPPVTVPAISCRSKPRDPAQFLVIHAVEETPVLGHDGSPLPQTYHPGKGLNLPVRPVVPSQTTIDPAPAQFGFDQWKLMYD